jgi:hypothetical protein
VTRPSFVGKGTAASTTATSVAPSYPAGVLENDFVIILNGSTTSSGGANANSITTPASWTAYSTLEGSDIDGQQRIFYRFAPAGGLSGSISIVCSTPTTNAAWYSQIYVYRGVNTTTPFEAGTNGTNATSGSAATGITLPTLTAYLQECLGVAFAMVGSSCTIASPTGETGGPDWVESTGGEDASATGDDGTIDAFQCNLDGQTVTGGSFTPSVTGGWSIRGFVLNPTTSLLTLGAGSAAGAGSNILAPVTATLAAGSAAAAGSNILAPVRATLAAGAATAAGSNLLAPVTATLGAGSAAAAGSSLLAPVTATLAAGSVAAAGSSLLAPVTATLGAGSAAAAGLNASPLTTVALGVGAASAAGSNILAPVTTTLAAGAASAAASDLLAAVQVALGLGEASASGADLVAAVISTGPVRHHVPMYLGLGM